MSGHAVPKELEQVAGALTASEVCYMLNITSRTLYRLIGRGEISAFKVGRDYRIWPSEIKRFVKADAGEVPA